MLTLERARDLLQCELDSAIQDGESVRVYFGYSNSLLCPGIELRVEGVHYRVDWAERAGTIHQIANAYKRATDFIAAAGLVPA